MRLLVKYVFIMFAACTVASAALVIETVVPPAPNGIHMPAGYRDWQVIGVAHRLDKHSLRIVLGNPAAMHALKNGQTNPWPDGAILAKVVWKETRHPAWPDAVVPGELQQAEFMLKDSQKYKTTAGWGFARWLEVAQKPYGESTSFDQECLSCHAAVKTTDHVFTKPLQWP